MLSNLAFFILSLFSVYRLTKNYFYILTICVCVILGLIPLGGSAICSLWGPALLIFPFLAFIFAAIGIAKGNTHFSLPLVVSATVMIQNHLTSIIIVVGLGLLAAIFYIIKKDGKIIRQERLWIIASLAIAALTCLPCIIDGLNGKGSNIYLIAHFFKSQPFFSHSFKEALIYILGFYLKPIELLTSFRTYWSLLVLALFAVVGTNTEEENFPKFILLFAFSGLCLSIFAAMKVTGDLLDFLFWLEYILVGLFYALAVMGFIRVGRWCLNRWGRSGAISKVWKFTFVTMAIASVAIIFSLEKRYFCNFILAPNQAIEQMIACIKPEKSKIYQIEWKKGSVDHMQWFYATGLVLKLTRLGYTAYVPDEWLFMFGANYKYKASDNRDILKIHLFSPNAYNHEKDKCYIKTALIHETFVAVEESNFNK
jgi:hypothetical protein